MGFVGTEENLEYSEKESRCPDKENDKDGCLLLFRSR